MARMPDIQLTGLATAFGIGLMIGAERERARQGPEAAAGVRTFALAALLGALAAMLGSMPALLTFAVIVAGLAAIAYARRGASDTGLTSEVAFVVTYLLGALAMTQPLLAAGLAVLVTVLLASRSRLHDFVLNGLSRQEAHDGLLLATSALIVLPLLPNRPVDPWGVLNPRLIFTLAVLFMAINALGYIAQRYLGARHGLPLAGFVAGFISSAATHSAMGARARTAPPAARSAVAGAALSSVATVLKLAAALALANGALLAAMALPLALSGAVAVLYGVAFTWHATDDQTAPESGRAFRLSAALKFAAFIGGVIAGSTLLVRWLGPDGAILGSGLAGLADIYAAAVSAGSLLGANVLDLDTARIAMLLGYSANAVTKGTLAWWSGGRGFALRLAPGLVLMVAAAWLGLWWENI